MSNNYNNNLNIILDDYYKCIGTFNNCKVIYKRLKNKEQYIENNTEEELIYKAQIEDLISNLGKIGEKSLKYIMGLEYIKAHPNADASSLNSIFKAQNGLRDFIKRQKPNIEEKTLNELMNYNDPSKQKAHNFDFWYKVLELIKPSTIYDIELLFYSNLQSESIYKNNKELFKNKSKKENNPYQNIYKQMPNELFSIIRPDILEGLKDETKIFYGGQNKENTDKYMEDKKNKIKEYGDAFTRFRYASNNLDNLEISLEEFFKIIDTFIFYIKAIHSNNDNLNINIVVEYAKTQCIKYKDLLNSSEEEIIKVFNTYISNDIDLTEILLSKFTFKEMSKMIDLEITKKELIHIIENTNLTSGLIKYYKSIGITDYYEMEKEYNKYLNNNNYSNNSKTRTKKR